MTKTLEEQAREMAEDEYMNSGYYGGKAIIKKGVVVGHKYFDFDAAYRRALAKLQEQKGSK